MKTRRGALPDARLRGAVVWKALLVVGVVGGGVWTASRLGTSPAPTDDRPEFKQPALIRSNPPTAASGRAEPAADAPGAPASDPFAGIDVKTDSVLRHIAGIEEKGRGRQGAAPKRAPAPPAEPAPRAATLSPAPLQEPATETRTRPASPVVAPPSVAIAAQVDAQRPPALPAQGAPAAESLVRAAVDTSAAAAERVAKGPVAPPATAPAPPAADRALAAARPEPAPSTPAVTPSLRVASRTMPEFPVEALRAGIRSGRIVARLSVDADGRVTATELLSASPSGYFERASRRALSTWRYEPPGAPTTADVELIFTRE